MRELLLANPMSNNDDEEPVQVLGVIWMTFDFRAVTDTRLVLLAINQLKRREVDASDVCAAKREVDNGLRCHGLRQMGETRFTIRPLPDTPLADHQYHHLDAWRFRPADGDYFLF